LDKALVEVRTDVLQSDNEAILELEPKERLPQFVIGNLLGGKKEVPGARQDIGQIELKGHIVVEDLKGVPA
jgi:hypothetical protein